MQQGLKALLHFYAQNERKTSFYIQWKIMYNAFIMIKRR